MNKTACASLMLLFSLFTESASVSAKDAGNYPYVHSDLDGRFYARSIPTEANGRKGMTEVFRVLGDKDQSVDKYGWYFKNGLRLGWSPIAGRVAVLAIKPRDDADLAKQTELEFYLGGKKLMSYSTQDMQKQFCSPLQLGRDGFRHAQFIVYGSRQVPGTNEYNFVVNIDGIERSFDILTGKERPNSAVRENWGEKTKWLEERIREAKVIKPGMSSAQLLKVFDVEAGLQSKVPTRYVLKSCPQIKIEVTFFKPEVKDPHIATVSPLYVDFVVCD